MPASAEAGNGLRIRGATRTVGVIGWPVDRSLSPTIHNAAFRALGLDWTYVPLPVEPGRLPAALDGLVALGFAGANVTMPHKTEAADLADRLADDARRLRAVNTLVATPDGLMGHNTDSPGFDRFLRRDVGFEPAGGTATILGAGGAARACALALARADLRSLVVAVRDPGRADDLRAALDGLPTDLRLVPMDGAGERVADLVVNATPAEVADELPEVPISSSTVVVDLVYRPAATPLLARAREADAPAHGGLGMLLHQAALSFELWTGQQPPLEAMSAAALAAIAP